MTTKSPGFTKRAQNNNHIRQLVSRVGNKRAAELLGVSTASINAWTQDKTKAPYMSRGATAHILGPENGVHPELMIVLPKSPAQTAAYKKIFEDAGVDFFRPLNK